MTARRGFTLVELMVATTLFLLVGGGTVGAFLAIQRMTRQAVSEAELSLRARELRDKLLFHQTPTVGGKVSTGLLSGNAFSDSDLTSSTWLNSAGLVDSDCSGVVAGSDPTKLYFINLSLTANGGTRYASTFMERLAVPIFGTVQDSPAKAGQNEWEIFGE